MREYLTKEWLPAVEGDDPPHHLQLLRAARRVPHRAAHRHGEAAEALGSQVNALYAKLAETGTKDGKTGLSPMTIHHVHACLHKACKDAVRWGQPPTQPARRRRPAAQEGRRHARR